jgi:hypothetical protein
MAAGRVFTIVLRMFQTFALESKFVYEFTLYYTTLYSYLYCNTTLCICIFIVIHYLRPKYRNIQYDPTWLNLFSKMVAVRAAYHGSLSRDEGFRKKWQLHKEETEERKKAKSNETKAEEIKKRRKKKRKEKMKINEERYVKERKK